MLILKKTFFFAFLTILQLTLFPQIFQAGILPDLFFVGLVVLCLLTSPEENLIWALILGIGLDSLMPFPLWFHLIFFLLTPVILHYSQNTIFTNQLLLGSFYLIITNTVYYLLYFLVSNSPIPRYTFLTFFNQLLFPVIFYNLLFFIILYFFCKLLFTPKINLRNNET